MSGCVSGSISLASQSWATTCPGANVRSSLMQAAAAAGPVQVGIEHKLAAAFEPTHLDIVNESYKHSVPKGSESHFKVTVRAPLRAIGIAFANDTAIVAAQIVSAKFDGMKLLARHRAVNEVLADELASTVHALSISAKTPAQWAKKQTRHETPNCLGGSKHDTHSVLSAGTGDEKK